MEQQGGDMLAESEEFQLLLAYCKKRTQRTQPHISGPSVSTVIIRLERNVKTVLAKEDGIIMKGLMADGPVVYQGAPREVVDRLVQIATSSKIPEDPEVDDSLEEQQDVVEKLVQLLRKSGDELDEQIRQNKVLQQMLQTAFNYTLFERVTSMLQGEVKPSSEGQAAGSEGRLHREKIAWAFEVTSRLSLVDVIPKRRALAFGAQYIHQHHSAWVQQHGGWEMAFTNEDIE